MIGIERAIKPQRNGGYKNCIGAKIGFLRNVSNKIHRHPLEVYGKKYNRVVTHRFIISYRYVYNYDKLFELSRFKRSENCNLGSLNSFIEATSIR